MNRADVDGIKTRQPYISCPPFPLGDPKWTLAASLERDVRGDGMFVSKRDARSPVLGVRTLRHSRGGRPIVRSERRARVNRGVLWRLVAFRNAALACGMLLVLVVTGCGSGSTRAMPHTEAFVRLTDIKGVGGGSPSAMTLRLWRAVQVGDAVSAASYYDHRVLRTIGLGRVSSALAQQRSHLEVLRPKILSVSQTPLGAEVVVKAMNMVQGTRENPIEIFSFVFRRASQGWRVAYDTLLGDSLSAYVEGQVQAQVAPGSSAPSPKAQIAGQRIGEEYRNLFSDLIERTAGTNRNRKIAGG
jgi:hypothetical protein